MKSRYRVPLIGLIATGIVWSVFAAPVTKLTDVISIDDLDQEVAARISDLEAAAVSDDAFQAAMPKLQLTVAQLTVFSQALAEAEGESKLKPSAASVRDVAIQFEQPVSFDEAKKLLAAIKAAGEANSNPTVVIEYHWSKLARKRTLMECLRERTDQIRKSIRRPKDPVVESRHASAMAVLAVAIAAQAEDLPDVSERTAWKDWSLELQREMTLTAAAIRDKKPADVLDHFRAGQNACDRCHEKFKR